MNRRFFFLLDRNQSGAFFAFFLCGVAFLCGALIGTFASDQVQYQNGVYDFLEGQFSIDGGTLFLEADFFSVLFHTLKYHLAALLLGTSFLGTVGIPLLSALRGFAFSFSLAVFVRCFGTGAIPASLLLFGVPALITIPCFLLVSVLSFCGSAGLLRSVFSPGMNPFNGLWTRGFFFRLSAALVLPVLAAVFETFFLPNLLNYFLTSL